MDALPREAEVRQFWAAVLPVLSGVVREMSEESSEPRARVTLMIQYRLHGLQRMDRWDTNFALGNTGVVQTVGFRSGQGMRIREIYEEYDAHGFWLE